MALKPIVLLLLISIFASVTLAHQVDEEGRPSLVAHKAGAAASYASGAAKSQTQIATDMQRLKAARPSRLGSLHRQAKELNQVWIPHTVILAFCNRSFTALFFFAGRCCYPKQGRCQV
jgi:hypothetical protein